MPKLVVGPLAQERIDELPEDAVLRKAVDRHLRAAASDPERHREPAPHPHRRDRRWCTITAYTTAGEKWIGFALFKATADEVEVTTLRLARDYTDLIDGLPDS